MGPVALVALGLGVLGGASLMLRRKRARGAELLEDPATRRQIAEVLGDPDGTARAGCLLFRGLDASTGALGLEAWTRAAELVTAPRTCLVVERTGRSPNIRLALASIFERSSLVLEGLASSPHLVGSPIRGGDVVGEAGPLLVVRAYPGWLSRSEVSAQGWLDRAGVPFLCYRDTEGYPR